MKSKLLFLLTILFFEGMTVKSQSSIPVFAGKVKSINHKDNVVTIKTETSTAVFYAYSPTVIRVRITPAMPKGDFSYAVIQKPLAKFTIIKEVQDSTILRTDSLQLVIYSNPMRVSVRNLAGDVLTEDYQSLPVSWQGTEVTCYKKLFPDERFLGLGEKTGNLNKRGSSYQNWNSDVPAYAINHDPLYQSIPFFIGVHDRVAYGIFLDNSFRTKFNFGASTDEQFSSFSAANGEMNYYVFGASTIAGIISDYTWLTGRMPMPPYWSLGYQQSRWSYFPESQLMSIANNFRDKKIPCDVLYLDIDYMDKYKIFTWNNTHFPNPKAMIDKLKGMGFHLATIVDPGIRIDDDYFAYKEGIANNYFAKYPDGRFYTGSVWPGRCHFPDFTNEKTRKWWGNAFTHLATPGVEGFWNDMNEPAAWGQSIPDIVQFDFEGRKGSMTEAHNIYGLEMSRATFEGTKSLLKGNRPFTLTRAGYAGIQRYAAVWTGDNDATDDHMLLSARMVTGLGLSGVSFTGPDVGGFMGNPSEQLYTRWMSLGVFTPFFRNHSAWDTKAKEPWSFGLNIESKVREMIAQRYRLLPYLYSAFYESSRSGMPVARSLAINYTFDEKVYWYKYQNQYMFGDNLLVAPVSCTQYAEKIYLPEGDWYRLSSGLFFKGNQEVTVDAPLNDLPVFVKASGIIPMQSDIQYTNQKPSPILDLHIYSGNRSNSFLYYEDDGITYQFESGQYYKRMISYEPGQNSIRLAKVEGSFPSKFDKIRIVLHSFDKVNKIKVNGTDLPLVMAGENLKTAEIPLKNDAILISY
jgi:alpha-glucosidase